MARKQKNRKLSYDPVLMDEILNQDGVKEQVDALTPNELKEFKLLLVHNGTYGRHVRRRQRVLLRNLARNVQWN